MASSDNFEGLVTLAAPTGGVSAGTMYSIGALVCLAMIDADATEDFTAKVQGRIKDAPKTGGTGLGWTAGDRLYWDDGESEFTTTATGNNAVAYAAADAATGATTGDVILLNGANSIS